MLLSDIIDKLSTMGLYPYVNVYFVNSEVPSSDQFFNITNCDYCWLKDLYDTDFTTYYRDKYYNSDFIVKNVVQLGNIIIIVYC